MHSNKEEIHKVLQSENNNVLRSSARLVLVTEFVVSFIVLIVADFIPQPLVLLTLSRSFVSLCSVQSQTSGCFYCCCPGAVPCLRQEQVLKLAYGTLTDV